LGSTTWAVIEQDVKTLQKKGAFLATENRQEARRVKKEAVRGHRGGEASKVTAAIMISVTLAGAEDETTSSTRTAMGLFNQLVEDK